MVSLIKIRNEADCLTKGELETRIQLVSEKIQDVSRTKKGDYEKALEILRTELKVYDSIYRIKFDFSP